MNPKTCPCCGYVFKPNVPSVSTTEVPFFTHRSREKTVYLCSAECTIQYIGQMNGISTSKAEGEQ